MFRSTRVLTAAVLAVGAVLGFLAASSGFLLKPAAAQDDPMPSRNVEKRQAMPGSPSATTTIDGRYLPNPPQAFKGEINPNALQSKPYWPARVVPPRGAPNVLLIMTDDTGFGAASTFGGVIPTPALDRLAKMGLRYTCMNSTALCSPSRAALSRAQPPLRGLRRGLGAGHGLPGL